MNLVSKFCLALCCGNLFLTCGCKTAGRPVATAPILGPSADVETAVTESSKLSVKSPDVVQASVPKELSSTAQPGLIERTAFDVTPTEAIPPAPASVSDRQSSQTTLGAASTSTAGMSLEQFEQIAIQNNPALAQSSASASKAAGFREQVGAYPNPNVGYSGQQLADKHTDQHLAFVEQEIVSANKLKLNQRVLDQEVQAQLWEVESQRYRVLTDVRQRFYEALAAQQRHDLALEFQKVAQEGVRVADIRRQALEGSVPEVLQSEIQLNEVELILQRADFAYQAAWQQLVAVAGVPNLTPVRLVGDLRVPSEQRDWNATYQQMLSASPELQAARARVTRSIANLNRQEVQAIPNLQTATSVGYDNGTQNSMFQIQAGVALPIFNKNQGNISAAQAEYCRSVQEVRRLEMALQSQLAVAARQYDSAAVTVERYETQILPKAQQTLDLSEKAYSAGEFGFLQVLVARRTFFDSNLEYNQALIELADAKWLIDGMLLNGGLNQSADTQLDDGLRGQTLSGQ